MHTLRFQYSTKWLFAITAMIAIVSMGIKGFFMPNQSELDFALCSHEFGVVVDGKPRYFPVTGFSADERVIALVWNFSGVIENGGFDALFSGQINGDDDFSELEKAFKAIGCQECIRKALDLFPDGKAPEDLEERIRIWSSLDEDLKRGANEYFWDQLEQITHNLARFIESRTNRAGNPLGASNRPPTEER